MPNLSRKERERLRHRREILDAAEKLFAGKGYHQATVQGIADEAEFSVGAIYNTFESKADLFVQLVDMRADEYFDAVLERLESASDPLEKVKVVIATKLEFFNRHKRFFAVFSRMLSEGEGEVPLGLSEHCRSRYATYQEKLTEVFRAGIKKGVFRHRDPLTMALYLDGITNVIIDNWIRTGGTDPSEAAPEEIESIFFKGVLAGGNH